MSVKETIIDNEELERCKNDKYYFFKKYVLINGGNNFMNWYQVGILNQNKDE